MKLVRLKTNILIVFFVLILNMLLFQNCSEKSQVPALEINSSQNKILEAESGNGSIFDGKIYVNRGEKCLDGSKTQSEIEIIGNSARVVKDQCQNGNQTVDLNSLQLLPHNTSNLIFRNVVFDELKENKTTKYLCRSHYKMNLKEGEHRIIGDFLLRAQSADDESYTGEFKFGFYRYDMTLASVPFTSGDLNIIRSQTVIDHHRFSFFKSTFNYENKAYNSELKLRMDNLEGWLNITPKDNTKEELSLKGPLNFGFRVLCYKQF